MTYLSTFLNSIGATLASYEACTQLEEFLLSRMNLENPNINFKCLVIIKVRSFNSVLEDGRQVL